MQRLRDLAIALGALAIGLWSAVMTYKASFEERNARLVEIGISILKVDPEKEPQISAARDWALDLIDANTGGVRFSKDAREGLRRKRLDVTGIHDGYFGDGYDPYAGGYDPSSTRGATTPPSRRR
jgi:hypothetical protein